ncbi:hypothetical protein HAX54_025145 [Datura stramonium]|uniref:RING-type E3 ubiquitin transferase n=1 Tax=Datura stramonium TaxID=4076 RepID=A0ABS8S7P6_DATST|nr:hypothetical protein [Datura stramonium]
MEPSTSTSEFHVYPEFGYARGGAAISGNNDFKFEINVIVKYIYSCGESTLDELNCDNTFACKYKSLSWDKIDETLLGTNFRYPLERVKWDPTEKILETKDDLIKHILEYAHKKIVTRASFDDLDEVFVSLIFVKQVSVSPQEFELTKARILAADREYCAELIWESVLDKIKKVGRRGSSLYEEFKGIECYIEDIVSCTSQLNVCFDEKYEKELIQSLIEQARKEFRSLPAVRSKIQFLQKINLPRCDDELTADICSICMEMYLPDHSEAYSMPCSHSFHFNCIETWLLKDPICPMCRHKLPPMETSESNEIHVFPQFSNDIRSPPFPDISGNNFNLEINLLVKHAFTSGENFIEEYNFGTRWASKYKSLSWDIVDRVLLETDFPYPLERVKWGCTAKILENKDDLIEQILEFARTTQNVTPPFQDDDTVFMSLVFVKQVSVSPQEFELTKARIVAKQHENIAQMLWEKVYDEIKGLGHGSSLYEELQWLECYIVRIVSETAYWSMYFDENYERKLRQSLIEQARKEFRSLPAVRSTMQFLQRVHLPENELTDVCSICMERYLPGSEAYSMPCSHSFHFGCIETWLLKSPSCPMCRYKLPPIESK